MGLFSFVGGLLGASAQKKASRKAEEATLGYLNKGIEEQGRQSDLTRADYQPYTTAGVSAIGKMGDIVGLNGNDKWAAALEALEGSPYLKSLFRNGEEAVLQNASATGGVRGGNTERSLADFRADAFAQAIQRELESLGGIASLGGGMATNLGSLGAHKADALTNLFGQQGAARAGGLLTRGGITAGMWNSAGGFLDSAVSAALGGMPGGFSLGSFKGF